MISEDPDMKRVIALSLCLLLLALFAACGKGGDPSVTDDTFYETPVTNPAFTETGTLTFPKDTVTIKVPLAFLKQEEKANLAAYADAHSFYSAEADEKKGIVTFKMSDLTHRLLLTRVGMDVIEALYGCLDDGTFPYFKGIENYDSAGFAELIILVDGYAYMSDPDADTLPYTLAQTCMVYQGFTEETKYRCRVLVKDEATGGLVKDETYTQSNKDFKQ